MRELPKALWADVKERLLVASRETRYRTLVRLHTCPPTRGFFDAYPKFFTTSDTAAAPDRLNQRYRALIQSNAAIIRGKRIVDIASHDGRWSLAANKAGAEYVLGIEARPHLVQVACDNLREYTGPGRAVEFVQGDVFSELDRLPPERFDTVFCFGFLYHTIDHMSLLRKIARLGASHLIIDTWISSRRGCIIEVLDEGVDHESQAAVPDPGTPTSALKGSPTKQALGMMLKAVGFTKLYYYDWQKAGIKRWDDLKAYYMGSRVTLTANAK